MIISASLGSIIGFILVWLTIICMVGATISVIYMAYQFLRGKDIDGKPLKDKYTPHIWG